MNPIWLLLLGATGTYCLRVLFIAMVPADRLPDRIRRALQLVGPAALAALIATDIGHSAAHPATLWPTLAAVLMAGLIAVLTKNLGFTILAGLIAALTIGLVV
jgi:branched-subunit amino acid transport protein